jgi:hypothetical protein
MMKKLLTVLMTIAISLSAMAEVPSLINYQGKLSDKSGTPVNGSKNFTVRIFDAKEGGKQIYEENVGTVTVKDGLYSFGFGEAGKSVVTPTEILARTDGEKQVFNYITKNKPILGNVTISGAGLSWTDDAGSSDNSKFTATLNKNSGAVSAIYLTESPVGGTPISITYNHHSDGVMDSLSRGDQAWLELSVDGEDLSPRERLVTVPFALKAKTADKLNREIRVPIYCDHLRLSSDWMKHKNITAFVNGLHVGSSTGRGYTNDGGNHDSYTHIYIPKGLDRLEITIDVKNENIISEDQDRTTKDITLPTPLALKLNGKIYPPTSFVSNTSTVIISEPGPGNYHLRIMASSYYEGYAHRVHANADFRIIGIYK